jgi:hypothetical protein
VILVYFTKVKIGAYLSLSFDPHHPLRRPR